MQNQLETTVPAGLQCVRLHSLGWAVTKIRLQDLCGWQADEADTIEEEVALLAEG